MQRRWWGKVGFVSGLVLVACIRFGTAQEAGKAASKSVMVMGKLAEVDAAGKTIKVASKNETQTFRIIDRTRLFKSEPAQLSDVQAGQLVRVYGKVAEDQTSIEARAIVIAAGDSRGRRGGPGITKMSVSGTVERSEDKISVQTADGKKVAVTTSDKTKVSRLLEAKFEDLKVDQRVSVNGRAHENEVVATRVTILPPAEPKKKADKKQ